MNYDSIDKAGQAAPVANSSRLLADLERVARDFCKDVSMDPEGTWPDDVIREAIRYISDSDARAKRLGDALREITIYTGEGPYTTPWQAIVKDITDHARAALEAEK